MNLVTRDGFNFHQCVLKWLKRVQSQPLETVSLELNMRHGHPEPIGRQVEYSPSMLTAGWSTQIFLQITTDECGFVCHSWLSRSSLMQELLGYAVPCEVNRPIYFAKGTGWDEPPRSPSEKESSSIGPIRLIIGVAESKLQKSGFL